VRSFEGPAAVSDGAPPPPAPGASALLRVDRVTARYGPVEALHDVSLEVREGEAVALVGANGAGKSTLMKCIMGMLPCAAGAIHFGGRVLSGRPVVARPLAGIGYAPEGRRVFPGLSVEENLLVASQDRDGGRQRMQEILRIFPGLAEKAQSIGWSLSGGQQQMLAIGRALMLRPRLLLLDEPSLGLSPLLMNEVLDRVRDIASTGTAVLLAEQNVAKALAVSGRAYVIKLGRMVHQGDAAALLRSDVLTSAFLGG
jgi:branched-chain amino acid transport system ATP-binding protein